MAKLLDPDFVPTGGQPGCELSGPPGVPHVETPHGHASVDAVDRTPGAGPSQGQSPAPDWTRDPRDAVEANLSSEARLADGDEGGGIVPIPGSSSPAETPSGDAPEARAERHLDRAASGVLFRRDEAAAMTVVELPSGLDLEILDEALEGGGSVSTVLRELRAELDAAIEAAELREPLPYPLPSPELVDLIALANLLRSSMVSGLFLGCRHVTDAEHEAMFGIHDRPE